jgi:hypothetical protein
LDSMSGESGGAEADDIDGKAGSCTSPRVVDAIAGLGLKVGVLDAHPTARSRFAVGVLATQVVVVDTAASEGGGSAGIGASSGPLPTIIERGHCSKQSKAYVLDRAPEIHLNVAHHSTF